MRASTVIMGLGDSEMALRRPSMPVTLSNMSAVLVLFYYFTFCYLCLNGSLYQFIHVGRYRDKVE